MKRLLLRADDFGFSEAVNHGIAKTVREGLIRSCGVMMDMDATAHAMRLVSDMPCCFGLHCNVSVGWPVCEPEQVPTLVDKDGFFRTSREYRQAAEDFASVEDLCRELTAQYRRFVDLFGKQPAYFEAHAVKCRNLGTALERVAAENGLFYQPSFSDFTLGGTYVTNLPVDNMAPDYDARAAIKRALAGAEDGSCCLYVCHPGYLDQYLLEHSSLTLARAKETEILCDPAIRRWLEEQGFRLVNYDDLAQEGSR